KPNPNPSASAIGGDLKITVKKSSRKKTSLESIRASISTASQACLTIGLICLRIRLLRLVSPISPIHVLISFPFWFERQLRAGCPQLIRVYAFCGVSRFAPEDGHERAFDAVRGVVAVFLSAFALTEHAVDACQRPLVVGFVLVFVVFVEEWRFGGSSASDC